MKAFNNFALLFAAFTVVFAITISTAVKASGFDDPKAPKKSTLAKTKWTINKIQKDGALRTPNGDRTFTVSFNDTTIAFASYCNNINASFSENNDNAIKMNKLDITQRVCSELAMSNEVEYIDILRRITRYEYDPKENVLRFFANDVVVIVMKKYESIYSYAVAPNGRRAAMQVLD